MAASSSYFVNVTNKEYDNLLKDGYLSQPKVGDIDYVIYEQPMNDWMMAQINKRLPLSAFQTNVEYNFPHFMFLSKEDAYIPSQNYVIIEVKVPDSSVVKFDDADYVHVVNNLAYKDMFLANNEQEAHEKADASPVEVEQSWERMFDVNRQRDSEYCGDIELRAMTPFISLDMLVGVVVM